MTDEAPTPASDALDPAALKDAHGKTGRMFQAAGLPFDEDEFDDEDSSNSSDSGSSSVGTDAPVAGTDEGAGD